MNKAIFNTKQVPTNLSEAWDKVTLSKFQLTNSRIDNINKTLHEQEEEIQLLMEKYQFTVNRRENVQEAIFYNLRQPGMP
eukprot:15365707-Ditylum_brightwellii.AAC.2